MACTSGCRTKDHASYAECLQDKGVRGFLATPSRGWDYSEQKRWDRELDAYRGARREGIQPDTTRMDKIVEAKRLSDKAGAAYGRDFSRADPMGD